MNARRIALRPRTLVLIALFLLLVNAGVIVAVIHSSRSSLNDSPAVTATPLGSATP